MQSKSKREEIDISSGEYETGLLKLTIQRLETETEARNVTALQYCGRDNFFRLQIDTKRVEEWCPGGVMRRIQGQRLTLTQLCGYQCHQAHVVTVEP